MVFAPAFAELDSEREVVLEEIAMVEDTPQDLVHDLLAEAVFGTHPLGRPVIGRADVISSVSRRALSRATTARVRGRERSSSPPPATSSTTSSCALLERSGATDARQPAGPRRASRRS